ncbi:MAG: putative paraquat-inducible protein A [Flavobacteriales bacterium]|jgi:uncharacterized paraquat-inducible protein A
MKKLKTILVAMVVMGTLTMVSCKDSKSETKAATAQEGTEYTSAYVCPMHCTDSGSDTEGTCGTCGMTLVKNEDHKANGHTHE